MVDPRAVAFWVAYLSPIVAWNLLCVAVILYYLIRGCAYLLSRLRGRHD